MPVRRLRSGGWKPPKIATTLAIQRSSSTRWGDQEAQQILGEIAREERAHGKALQSMVPALGPQGVLDAIMKRAFGAL